MQLILNVPDDSPIATEIAGWENGVDYDFRATQTAPNTFDVVEATLSPDTLTDEPIETEETEEAEETPLHSNPAIDRVMRRQ